MHHPGGYGRYYDMAGCDDYARGCTVKVAEQLARDVVNANFTMSETLAFPLTLRISQLEVTRMTDGKPSIFLTIYSPTGGTPTATVSSQLVGWLWVPLLLSFYCCLQFLSVCTADQQDDVPQEASRPLKGPGRRSHE